MLKIENTDVYGFSHAIRGMRNPRNSWDRSDSGGEIVGPNDLALMKKLSKAGSDHRKAIRTIVVYVDITAPLYWWKEFKTYRNGRRFGDEEPDIVPDEYLEYDIEMNSCSTMHTIAEKEFTTDDFSCEHLMSGSKFQLRMVIDVLNDARKLYLETHDKAYWWQIIQLLPASYNQRRTVMLNYEVLKNMYHSRKNHKLDEWRTFCEWIETLPYSEIITEGGK